MNRIVWTDEMLAAFRAMRARGTALYEVAEAMGIAYPTAVRKARELGLNGRLNAGAKRGKNVIAESAAGRTEVT